MVPDSTKEVSPVIVTSDSNDALPPAADCTLPCRPSEPITLVTVELGELVAALSTFGDAPGPPCPLNCMA
jgi:hypothetical protein